ncbi:MAG: O-antigen ligase family protein [Pseudobdellovibrio sp.]
MIYFLILLIFVSKVSLAVLPGFPQELSPVIYQYGLHPYVNIFLCLTVGGLVILKWLWSPKQFFSQSRFFRFSIVLTSLYLILITLLQCLFVNPDESSILQMGSAFLAIFTIFLFGRVIPTSINPEDFLKFLKKVTVLLCWISLIALFAFPGISFKGSRFIGIFKHIPHMVSCATLACFALMHDFVLIKKKRIKIFLDFMHFAIAFALLMLTGTRSALASVAMGLLLVVFLFPSLSNASKFLKLAFVMSLFLITLFFGEAIGQFGYQVATGEKSIGSRVAQDGVSSRLEEVERGYEIFQKNPWLGQGILSKFSAGNDTDVSNYNANKDPHNILLSAGVVGGLGFVFITIVLLSALGLGAIRTLATKNKALKILAIYVLAQLPILAIYHIHLSVGGIADRIYWIAFGYMALKEIDVKDDEILQ